MERYARACRVRECSHSQPRVRVLDIGTGLGWNLAAALEEWHGSSSRLEVVCLESDPSVIEAALALHQTQGLAPPGPARSAYQRIAEPLAQALSLAQSSGTARVNSPGWQLQLCLADARVSLPAIEGEPFDAVFLDAFSPGVERELWDWTFLANIARCMAPQALLSTYTVSMGVRAGLIAAGLRIGAGPRVGAKASGTLASWEAPLASLDQALIKKLERRSARGGPAG